MRLCGRKMTDEPIARRGSDLLERAMLLEQVRRPRDDLESYFGAHLGACPFVE